jgi:alkanesulfonate monooxygenase SsuD/methylene tetrahydromethanopterin reductase-like flavin-dependent oxidoreductase (luciferase family)
MDFALFSHIPWPEERTPRGLFAELTEQAVIGEELGFKAIWLAEHHFTRYGLGASSLIIASNIAARTQRIRLGTAVLIPALHHPVRLAEDTATLDVLSDGRLDVGFGRGASSSEYGNFGVDHAESQARYRETIQMVETLWTTPDCSFKGDYYATERLNLVPTPIQEPHPPVYVAATRSAESLDFVATTGRRLIIGVVLDTDDCIDLLRRFLQKAEESGSPATAADVPVFRYFYVAETEEQAHRDAREALNWTLDINTWRREFAVGSEVYQSLADYRQTRTTFPPTYDYLAQNRAFIGTPDQCAAQIRALHDAGVRYFGCNFAFGGLDHARQVKSMELFAREVMPRFEGMD